MRSIRMNVRTNIEQQPKQTKPIGLDRAVVERIACKTGSTRCVYLKVFDEMWVWIVCKHKLSVTHSFTFRRFVLIVCFGFGGFKHRQFCAWAYGTLYKRTSEKKTTRTKNKMCKKETHRPNNYQHTGNFIMDFITSTLSPQLLQHNASVLRNMFRCLCVCLRVSKHSVWITQRKIQSSFKEHWVVRKAFTERAANQRHETLDYYVVQHNVKWVAPGNFIITCLFRLANERKAMSEIANELNLSLNVLFENKQSRILLNSGAFAFE